MGEFSSYEKMPSSVKKLGLSEGDFATLDKWKWVVTEKVHGANFSFVYEDRTLKFGKRKEYLAWTDDFFGFQLVANALEEQILRLFEDLSAQVPGRKYTLYGELFGGKYPHPDVPEVPNVGAIQTGVYYAPGIHFCAFDIAIETDQTRYYLDYESAVGLFEKHEIFYAKPLLVGKYNEAVNFDTRMNSAVPAQLGFPELAENLIEGVVIKPYNQVATEGLTTRPILKLKNKEFDEEKKFHEAEKWSYVPDVNSKTEDLSYILEEVRNYITANRLESAISKIGALDHDNPQRVAAIAAEFCRDALADFDENNDNLLGELSESDQSWLHERVRAEVKRLMQAPR